MTSIKNFNLLTVWLVIGLLFIAFAVSELYSSNTKHLYDIALDKHHKAVYKEIENTLSERQAAAVTLALSLADNSQVKDLLCENCDPQEKTVAPDFRNLVSQLELNTEAGNLWIQVIDNKGISRFRSWTKKTGDNLRDVRYDVRQMLGSHSILTGMSVGRFSLTFKAMVPVKDSKLNLIGMLEVITKLDTYAEHLKRSVGSDSVVLVDERFKAQLTRADQNRFLGDFYIANKDAKAEYIAALSQMGSQRFTEISPVFKHQDNVITQYIIQDGIGQKIGYWFVFDGIDRIDVAEVRLFEKQFIFAAIVVVSLVLMLSYILFLQQKTSAGRRYYRNIINTTSEIIVICSDNKITEVNKRFFEFFSEYKSIEDFVKHHSGIEELFSKEEGTLGANIAGNNWLEFILDNQDKEHIAKLNKQNEDYFFKVQVAVIEETPEKLYSIVMHDVTKQIRYQRHLEQTIDKEQLTGSLNRSAFARILRQETARSLRYKKPLCLVGLDVNGIEEINNKHGFEQGDQALIRVSRMIKSLLRETDSLSRINGTEFTILMPETSLDEAKQAVLRINKSMRNIQQEFTESLRLDMGVADLKAWEKQDDLLQKADNALQQAKRQADSELIVAQDTPEQHLQH